MTAAQRALLDVTEALGAAPGASAHAEALGASLDALVAASRAFVDGPRARRVVFAGDLAADAGERRDEVARFREEAAARAAATAAERQAQAATLLAAFAQRLSTPWLEATAEQDAAWRARHERRRPPAARVMVGTLNSGEHEYLQCRRAIEAQTHRDIEHVVLAGLAKRDAVAALMETFAASDCEYLVKVDADMVLLDERFVERVVAIMAARPAIDLLQMAVMDFFSARAMHGINAYRRGFAWDAGRQDPLFTDRTQVAKQRRLVTWAPFLRSAIHSPDPWPFQAFHFGVHRGLKVLQPDRAEPDTDVVDEQTTYLEQTWEHFAVRGDARLGFAALGFELAIAGEFALDDVDYTSPTLRGEFRRFADWSVADLRDDLRRRRDRAAGAPARAQRVHATRRRLLHRTDAPIESVVFVLPHIGVFGGVNRFFELALQLDALGVECAIAVPRLGEEDAGKSLPAARPDYPTVTVMTLDAALERAWDVALCGDCTSGVMLTLPLFEARVSAAYILNGWMRHAANARQIEMWAPDVVIANSSYAARYYQDLAPVVVPGGVDLATFRPHARPPREGRPAPFRVAAYGGRRKGWKGFPVVLEACRALHACGVPVELNVFDARAMSLDEPFAFRFHGRLVRDEVARLLRGMDAMLAGELDAGWSNPTAEAMACGVPLACTEAGTMDFAVDGETALVVPKDEPLLLADAAERLWRDPELGRRLAAAGRRRIEHFDWSAVARRLLDVFRDVRRDGRHRQAVNARAVDALRRIAQDGATELREAG